MAPNQLTFLFPRVQNRDIFGLPGKILASGRQNQGIAFAGHTFPASSNGPTTDTAELIRKEGRCSRSQSRGSPAAWGGLWWSRYHTAASGEQRPGRNCGVWREVHTGAGFLDLWGLHSTAIHSWRTALLGKDPLWSNSSRTAACGKEPHWSSSYWSKGKVWGGINNEDNVLWTNCKSHSPSKCSQSRRVRNEGVESGKNRVHRGKMP